MVQNSLSILLLKVLKLFLLEPTRAIPSWLGGRVGFSNLNYTIPSKKSHLLTFLSFGEKAALKDTLGPNVVLEMDPLRLQEVLLEGFDEDLYASLRVCCQ
jgi:hypothetical protein